MAPHVDMARRQRILADFGEFALGSDDLDDVLTEACRLVADALGTDRAKVLEIQEDGRELLVRAGVGWRADIVGRLRLSLSEASSETFAIEAGGPVITRDIREETRFVFADFMKNEGVRALVNVPIFVPGRRAYGILQVDATEPRDFTEADTEFLRTYSTILGPVIDRLHKVKRLREAEAREREREVRFRTVFDSASVGLAIVSPEGKFLRVNRELARILGRSEEELVSMSAAEVTHGPDVEPTLSAFRKCLETGKPASLDKHYRRPNGELVPANSTMTPLPPSDGASMVLAVTVDLTDRKQAEAVLRESEARHRLLIGSWAQAVWEADADGAIVADSPSWRAYTGQTLEEWLSSGWLNAIHPDDRAHAARQWRDAIAARGLVDAEFRIRAPGGGWRWTNVRAAPVLDDRGRIVKWAGMNIDIEARKQAETALRQREADLARVQRIGAVGGLDIDVANGLTSRRSPEYLRLHGLQGSHAEETHAQWRERLHPDDREEAERQLFAALEDDGASYEGEYRIVRPNDGAVRWIHARADIERDPAGRPLRLVGAHLDVTAAKEASSRMEVLVAELQHRTRNLVGVVRAMANRTADGASDLPGFLERFHERLAALSRINGLLSKLNKGERVTFDEMLRTELEARGFKGTDTERVVLEGPAGIRLRSATVQTFALAIHELATNAVKYGALSNVSGRLRVLWRLHIDGAGESWLRVEWRESGVADMPEAGAEPRGGGYGRMLIERALPYQLQAKTTYALQPGGVRCTIDLPLR